MEHLSLMLFFLLCLIIIVQHIMTLFDAGIGGNLVVCISRLINLIINQKPKYTDSGLVVEFVGDEPVSEERTIQWEAQLLFISPAECAIGNITL